jgi:DNA helicase-2/ATP-dependent DNA helicase PcrA
MVGGMRQDGQRELGGAVVMTSPGPAATRAGLTGPDAVLAALDPEQQQVALAVRGPVCVLAGAGTGKTRAIAHRIAYAAATGVMDPGRILAVTFTTRAAGELRGRLRQLGTAAVPGAGLELVQARTFHSAALRQLTHFWPGTVGGPAPRVLESKIGLLAETARRLRLQGGPAELRDAASEIEWAKVSQIRPEDYPGAAAAADRSGPYQPQQLARLYAGYEELRRERNLIDFESVLELTAAILGGHPAAAAAVRDRYRYFVVDEYQDVNPLQKLLLDQWADGRDDVCVVGDPRQTIYSFAGATPAYLTGFAAQYPGATVIRLVRNYRSTPQVVGLANAVGAGDGPALAAQRPPGPEPRLTEYDDEPAETRAVARQAAELIRSGTPAREIALLVRINAQTQGFEQALAAAGVPYRVRGAERFFDRSEVRQAVGLIRAAARSADADTDALSQVRGVLSGLGLDSRPPTGRGQARERWESLEALAQLAADFLAAAPAATVADLAAELELRGATGHVPAMDGVTLASLHAAKGLEWDVVFLPGLTEGILPIVYAQTDAAITEERRLLYVGVTRARQRLYLSWALARSPGGRRTRKPSRFVAALAAAPGGTGRRAERRDGDRRRDRSARDADLGLSGPDGVLFAALRDWRLGAAKEQSVPAYVIFSDATLAAIARRRPASRPELAAIPGIGAVKLDRYGSAVLALCADGGRGTPAATPAGAEFP